MATFIEALLGKTENLNTQSQYLLSSIQRKSGETVDSKTATVAKKQERIKKSELEYSYRVDSFIFNAVNVAEQLIMSAGYELETKKAMTRKWFEEFLKNLSRVGADSTWNEILTRIYQDCYIYGGSYNELVWNEADTKIVDIKILDPKEMDFARDSNENIALNGNGKPLGFVQTVPYEIDPQSENFGDEKPEVVALNEGNQIFIEARRICYIPLYTYGAGFEGMGKVEPAYKATIWKLNLLKAGAESSSRRGFSPIIARVGTENVHPTPQMVANVLEKLKSLDYSKYMAIPNYVELVSLDVKTIETYEGFLKYLTAMQSAALGIPVPFVTGLGEETNRSTLGTQLEVLKISLNTIAARVSSKISQNMFKPIAESNGLAEFPDLKWGEISIFYETNTQSGSKQGNKEDKEGNEEDEDKTEEKKKKDAKKLELTASGNNKGAPLDNSYQNQGVSQTKRKKKKKSSS